MQQPTLTTERLYLRPFNLDDAARVQRLAGDSRIADATSTIPHPYPDGAAEAWISTHQRSFESRHGAIFAVTLLSTAQLVGAVSLINVSLADKRAKLGYWVGVEFWRLGLCSEASRRLIAYSADSWGISRFVAKCLSRNPAPARVMEKVGMLREGRLLRILVCLTTCAGNRLAPLS